MENSESVETGGAPGKKTNRRAVIGLDAISDGEAPRVGGKAWNLGRLTKAGFAVPAGFALTVDAFTQFVQENRLETEISSALRGEGNAEVVRGRITSGTWPAELKKLVVSQWNDLQKRSPGKVAVRSSATDEDSADSSFAGQHATLLNVDGADAVLRAVSECWASLLQPEAIEYRRQRGLATGQAKMGVVVQTMVPAEVSGVLFTIDPVLGDRDLIVVDATTGLGEALVSGNVTPDHFVVRRTQGADRVLRRDLASNQAVLTDEGLLSVVELGLAVEKALGGDAAQDIEWSFAKGKFWLLQSRPITSDGAPKPCEFDTPTDQHTQWTSINMQEVMPGLLSPLTQTMLLKDFAQYTQLAISTMGIELLPDDRLVGSFYGRAFLNHTLAQEIGGQTGAADEHYFGKEEAAARKKNRMGPAQVAVVLPKSIWTFSRLEKLLPPVEKTLQRWKSAKSLGTLTNEQLLSRNEEITADIHAVGRVHVLNSIFAGAMFTGLGKLCEKALDDKNGELQGRLVKALPHMDSAMPAFVLWRLAEQVRKSNELRQIFALENGAAIAAAIADGRKHTADVQTLGRDLDAFLAEYGHHSTSPMEVSALAWEEDVPTVLEMVKNYVAAPEDRAPAAITAREEADRDAATREARERIDFLRRPIFNFLLTRAQKWLVAREHSKTLLLQSIHRRRMLIRELGRRLAEKGQVAHGHDVCFLTWSELAQAMTGRVSALREAIGRRKAEQARVAHLTFIETFRGRPVPLAPEPVQVPADRRLEGIAVSRGVVTGRARVILDPQKGSSIQPGEILVAPVTDAGWGPLFTVAAGLVVDIGGALSHGSTVAREFGIPAVVNVKRGTQVIRTGDLITVDGTRGVVTLG